jgi:hypothetical protein
VSSITRSTSSKRVFKLREVFSDPKEKSGIIRLESRKICTPVEGAILPPMYVKTLAEVLVNWRGDTAVPLKRG